MRFSIGVGNVTLTLHLTAPRLEVDRAGERIPPVSRTAPQPARVGVRKLVAETRAAKPAWRAADEREAARVRSFDLNATQVLSDVPEPLNFCAPVTMATISIEV